MQAGSWLYTDSASSYRAVKGYVHEFVNHTQKKYARGEVHENRAECLSSLLKPLWSAKIVATISLWNTIR